MAIVASIIIIPLVLGILLVISASTLGEDHTILKWLLFLSSFIMFFLSLRFGMLAVVHFYDWPAFEASIGQTTWTIGILFGLIIVYLFIYMVYKGFRQAEQDKNYDIQY